LGIVELLSPRKGFSLYEDGSTPYPWFVDIVDGTQK